jgi:hypothetical protein
VKLITNIHTGGNEQLKQLEAIQKLKKQAKLTPIPQIPAPCSPAPSTSPRRRATYDVVVKSHTQAVADPSAPPPVKRARTENDVAAADTSVVSVASTRNTTITSKKGKGRAKKPLPEPWTCKDFKTRFPHPTAYIAYLNGTPEERHPIVMHRDAPLDGVRAFFVSFSKGLSKSMAVNMNHLFRLGGRIQNVFVSPFSSTDIADMTDLASTTTHLIVYSEGTGASMKFKDVMKALNLVEEALLVGQSVADGDQSTSRDLWVIRSDWLVECVKQADQKRPSGQKAKKLSEMAYLVECEGDKKRRKNFLLRKMSSASVVVDPPDMDNFHMPESQLST